MGEAMRNYVNLMSDSARLRAAMGLRIRCWATAWAVIVIAVMPFAGMRWLQRRGIEQQRAALEARYEPFGRLSVENRRYRTEALKLVKQERIPLELSRKRSVAALLGLASKAAAATDGELYIQQLTFTQDPLAAAEKPKGKLIIEASGTLAYDVAGFIEALNQAPFASVRVLSTEVETQDDVEQKNYSVECVF
jgi:hypothetical protein